MKLKPSDIQQLQRDRFWSEIRAKVCASLRKRRGTYYQWEYLAGRKSRTASGERITLDKHTCNLLQGYVDYYNTSEGIEELSRNEIATIPEHIDDIAGEIMNVPSLNEIKRQEFQIFLRYRGDFLNWLKDIL